jgi:hypothetical protein
MCEEPRCSVAHTEEDRCRHRAEDGTRCNHRIASGKRRYCWGCSRPAAAKVRRREWRERLKQQGAPAWRRNGWKSAEKSRVYHRTYMIDFRAGKREANP